MGSYRSPPGRRAPCMKRRYSIQPPAATVRPPPRAERNFVPARSGTKGSMASPGPGAGGTGRRRTSCARGQKRVRFERPQHRRIAARPADSGWKGSAVGRRTRASARLHVRPTRPGTARAGPSRPRRCAVRAVPWSDMKPAARAGPASWPAHGRLQRPPPAPGWPAPRCTAGTGRTTRARRRPPPRRRAQRTGGGAQTSTAAVPGPTPPRAAHRDGAACIRAGVSGAPRARRGHEAQAARGPPPLVDDRAACPNGPGTPGRRTSPPRRASSRSRGTVGCARRGARASVSTPGRGWAGRGSRRRRAAELGRGQGAGLPGSPGPPSLARDVGVVAAPDGHRMADGGRSRSARPARRPAPRTSP